MDIKTISVIGAGAVGAVVADQLNNYLGKDAVQILAQGERLERYKKDGLYLDGNKLDFNYVSPDQAKPSDLVIIATKNLQLDQAIQMTKSVIKEDTAIISLLNGIQSEIDLSNSFGKEHVLYGFVLSLNSIHVGNKIECSNKGCLFFGEEDNSQSDRVKSIKQLFDRAGLKYNNPQDIKLEQWKKYLINVTFNTLSAITRSTYGGFRFDAMQDLSRKVGSEVIALANAMDIPLTKQMLEDDIKLMCSHDIYGKTSMLQDMEAARKSENDWFCGTVVRLGSKYNIQTPYCDFLQKLVEGTELVRTL